MKKYLVLIICLLFVLPVYADADQTFLSGMNYSAVSSFDYGAYDIVVEPGAEVSSVGNTITMTGSVCLHNNGTIYADIDTNEQNLFVYNSGTISGNIINTNGIVTQIITSAPEITNINVTGGTFNVQIENFENLNFSDIQYINPASFDLKNTSIVINNFTQWQNWGQTITLSGPIS